MLSAKQKALRINLNQDLYGTFAEIGAGQEVGGGESVRDAPERVASPEGRTATETRAADSRPPEGPPKPENVAVPARPILNISIPGKDEQLSFEELLRRELPQHMAISR